MNWKNTRLIFRRELNDQWRDRRTIFTILVMPLVLYPLMGMALLQTAQLMHQAPPRVLVLGSELLENHPGLLNRDGFHPDLRANHSENPIILVWDDALIEPTRSQLTKAIHDFQQDPTIKPDIRNLLKGMNVDLVLSVKDAPDKPSGAW